MPRARPAAAAILAAGALLLGSPAGARADGPALYRQHCGVCHGADRLGGTGPALLPESLGRLAPAKAIEVIAQGRAGTQMPGFSGKLAEDEIAEIAAYIYGSPAAPPRWGVAEMRATQKIFADPARLPDAPVFGADPLNLFVVVESGDHHVSILDGDGFMVLARFQSHFALHGGPKFSPDGRFVYFASRDGWITKYDLWGLQAVADIRAGINTRNLALSPDGAIVMVANYLPHTLVALDARDLSPLEVIEVKDMRKERSSRVSAVYQAAPRKSFIVALKDAPELWEVYFGPEASKRYRGFVHSYEKGMVEALRDPDGSFVIRRIGLREPLEDFFFDPAYRHAIGSAREGGRAVVINLDVGREVAALPLPGLPHLGSGIAWVHDGRPVLATPHLEDAAVSVIDMKEWKLVRRIETLGPGFFLRSHEASDYAIADVSLGKEKDAIQVIDKRSLEVVRTLRPAPGKIASHAEFTRDGRRFLVSVMDMEGAVVAYDASTFNEIARIPMSKPLGKYNVYNKIHRSDGTSH